VGYVVQNNPRHQASQFYIGYLQEAVAIFESAIERLKQCEYSHCEIADAVDMAHRIKGNAAMYGYPELGLKAGKLEALLRGLRPENDHANSLLQIISLIDAINRICHGDDKSEPVRLQPTLAINDVDCAVSQSPASASGRKSILVAYQDVWICEFLSSLLEPEFSVISCNTKEALFHTILNGPADLLILENNLCGESGIGLLKRLKGTKETKGLPVFLAFDNDPPEVIAEAIGQGVAGFAEDKLEILEIVNSARALVNKSVDRVLVVDDDPVVQQLLSQALKSAGLNVDTAKDGLDALNYLSKNTPDIVLLDRFMPRLEGGTVLYEIQNKINLKSIPVLILTSMVNQGEAKSWFERGAADFIPKPFDPEEVVMRVKQHLDKGDDAA